MAISARPSGAAWPDGGSAASSGDRIAVFDAWPERLLGVSAVHLVGREVVGSIEAGPYLSWDGCTAAAGSLGVLVDDVTGYSLVRHQPAGMASVSTEITLDLLGAIPIDGTPIVARARAIQRDQRGGLSTAELRTAQGDLIAVATQRGRFVAAAHSTMQAFPPPGGGERAGTLETLLWPDGDRPTANADGHVDLRVGPRFVNRLGTLHGGLSILLVDEIARAAIRGAGGTLSTASIHVGYLRPVLLGSTISLSAAVVHRGNSSGVVHVVGRTETGKPGVVATVTLH